MAQYRSLVGFLVLRYTKYNKKMQSLRLPPYHLSYNTLSLRLLARPHGLDLVANSYPSVLSVISR